MVKKVLLAVAVLIAGFLVFVATRPDTYHVERSTTIKAPADVVFATIGDLKSFGEWSPWEKRDPNMKRTFSASTTGVGATYAWQGNKDVGSGQMTITESKPPSVLREKLEFIEPFKSVADIAFDVAPAGAGEVKTTWAMDGHANFISKGMGVFLSMDKMIGKDFEEGLANLKRVAESKAAAAPAANAPAAAAGEAAPAAK